MEGDNDKAIIYVRSLPSQLLIQCPMRKEGMHCFAPGLNACRTVVVISEIDKISHP